MTDHESSQPVLPAQVTYLMNIIITGILAFFIATSSAFAQGMEQVPQSGLVSILSTLTTVYSGRLGIGGVVQVNVFKADDSVPVTKECDAGQGLSTCPRYRLYVAIGGGLGVPTQLWRSESRVGWIFDAPQIADPEQGISMMARACEIDDKMRLPWRERAFRLRVDTSDYLHVAVSLTPENIVSDSCQTY